MTPLLECHELSVEYGGVRAVDHASLSVEPGQILGLIGPNGACKTTFVEAISGFVATSSGSHVFDGHDLADRKPHSARASDSCGRSSPSSSSTTCRCVTTCSPRRAPTWRRKPRTRRSRKPSVMLRAVCWSSSRPRRVRGIRRLRRTPAPGDVVTGEVVELDRDELWAELEVQAKTLGKSVRQHATRWTRANRKNIDDATAEELFTFVESNRARVAEKRAQVVAEAVDEVAETTVIPDGRVNLAETFGEEASNPHAYHDWGGVCIVCGEPVGDDRHTTP